MSIEIIKSEYKLQFFDVVTGFLSMIAVLAVPLIIFLCLLCFFNPNQWQSVIILFGIGVILLFMCLFFYSFFDSYKDYRLICKNEFRIVTDKLFSSKEPEYDPPVKWRLYTLKFENHGEYAPDKKSYITSKMYAMDDEGVYNYSTVGDEFYLIVNKKNKILLAYNKKMFDLENEKILY